MILDNNFDNETMNNIKNLVDNGNISEAISKISPEMIENFSKMMNSNNNNNTNNSNNSNNTNTTNTYKTINYNQKNYNANNNSNNSNNSSNKANSNTNNKKNFDFSQIDMNTILKMKSVMENMNNSDDPRSNLLYSLKPYLRQTKQEKLDQYVNLLNFSKVAEILKNDKKDDGNA